MTVERLDSDMSSREFSQWIVYYRMLDDMKGGKGKGAGEGEERGD